MSADDNLKVEMTPEQYARYTKALGKEAGGSAAKWAGGTVAAVGALMVLIGSFLPWSTVTSAFGTASNSGIDGDGKLTIIAAVVMLVGVLVIFASKYAWIGAMIVGVAMVPAVIICILKIADINDVISRVSNEYAQAHVGYGLYVIIAGAVIATIGGIVSIFSEGK